MEGGFFAEPDEPSQHAPFPHQQPQHNQGCTRCPSLSWNAEWFQAFGVRLCNLCKRQEPLISKSNAKQRYHVSDADLKGLGFIRKANPHRRDWQPMALYLQSQVEALSHGKHGGAEGLEEYAQGLLDKKMQERKKKRESQKREEEEGAAKRDRVKRRLQEEEERRRQQQDEALRQGASREVEVEEI